jgi:hypothetical protein
LVWLDESILCNEVFLLIPIWQYNTSFLFPRFGFSLCFIII